MRNSKFKRNKIIEVKKETLLEELVDKLEQLVPDGFKKDTDKIFCFRKIPLKDSKKIHLLTFLRKSQKLTDMNVTADLEPVVIHELNEAWEGKLYINAGDKTIECVLQAQGKIVLGKNTRDQSVYRLVLFLCSFPKV